MVGTKAERVESVDLVRGLAMVVMALDHVRDHFIGYGISPTDLQRTTAAMFLTRLASHFCAPAFFLTAGIGASLALARGGDLGKLRRFLLARGVWLMALEVAFVNVMFLSPPTEVYLQTFWALGWSMVALAALTYLPRGPIALIGTAMILGHNFFDGVRPSGSSNSWGMAWGVLHVQGKTMHLGPLSLHVQYPLVPWIGVMAVGYAIGPLFAGEAGARRRMLAALGTTCLLGFLLARGANAYGDPSPWSAQPRVGFTALSFLDVSKYPPSLSYLLLTLGVTFWLLLGFEKMREGGAAGAARGPLLDFGRVPMFFYLLHLALINAAFAAWLGHARGAAALADIWRHGPPPHLSIGLGAVYAIWAGVIAALWPACRWYRRVKAERAKRWMAYV